MKRLPRVMQRFIPILLLAGIPAGVWCGELFAEVQTTGKSQPRRLVVIKSDGLPPDLLAAVALPERKDLLARLDYADDLTQAMREYRKRTGRQIILPNIRKHFYQDGVVFDNIYSHTVTLSAASWGVIDTGQPSVVKGHGDFSRDTCYVRAYLDGFRETVDALKARPGTGEFKTVATWNLDQAGVSLFVDAFDPLRTWAGAQLYHRVGNKEILARSGLEWLTTGRTGFGGIAQGHLSRLVTGLDYVELNEQMNARLTAGKVLALGPGGEERFDLVNPVFTMMDHQQHVDPHPANLVNWLAKQDEYIGEIFEAIARSERREDTIVVLISDHGSEVKPGTTSFSFPVSRAFREPLLGSHNVKTLRVENAWSAVTLSLPGYDWPRRYESPYSPYGERNNPGAGTNGYVTAFLDPYGNGRVAAHLRNNDLNRLHLVLQEFKKSPRRERFQKLKELFKATLDQTRLWLEPDLDLYRDYHDAAQDLAQNLRKRMDRRSHDVARRLREEAERDQPQITTLTRLLNLTFEEDQEGLFFDEIVSNSFDIDFLLPKQYLGVVNSLYQLTHYTLGLGQDLEWVETTVDSQGRPVPMNYLEALSNYRVANPPAEGLENPFDLIVGKLPVMAAEIRLRGLGLIAEADRLSVVVWVKSTDHSRIRRGGEALIIGTEDQRIKYVPVRGLGQDSDGTIQFELAKDIDPLGLLKSPDFLPPGAAEPLDWMKTFHFWRDWLPAIHRTEYSIGLISLLDVFGNPTPAFIDNPELQSHLDYFSSRGMKRRYFQGLKRKYATGGPDLVVWSDELWNFNSEMRNLGTHGGMRPITTRTVFSLWGGDNTGLPRGEVIEDVCTTLDIVPTLFHSMGMLDDQNRVVPRAGANPEQVFFLPFPGRPVELGGPPPEKGQSAETLP